jgi:hypothetical protein
VEGAAVLALSIVLFWRVDGNWLLFVVLLLAPDVGMLGYARGTSVGAAAYNLFHTYTSPALLALAGLVLAPPLVLSIAIVWAAHIGMDRLLGYGLKYPTAFKDTHLGRL